MKLEVCSVESLEVAGFIKTQSIFTVNVNPTFISQYVWHHASFLLNIFVNPLQYSLPGDPAGNGSSLSKLTLSCLLEICSVVNLPGVFFQLAIGLPMRHLRWAVQWPTEGAHNYDLLKTVFSEA